MLIALAAPIFLIKTVSTDAILSAFGISIAAAGALGFAASLLLRTARSSCCGRTPIQIAWQGERFKLTFGNAAYGERVASS